MAGTAKARARLEVTKAPRNFLQEGMYTFLDERCPAGRSLLGCNRPVGCGEAVRWMRGPGGKGSETRKEVWREAHEKSKSARSFGYPDRRARFCPGQLCASKTRRAGGEDASGGHADAAEADQRTAAAAGAAAERYQGQDRSEREPGDSAGDGEEKRSAGAGFAQG